MAVAIVPDEVSVSRGCINRPTTPRMLLSAVSACCFSRLFQPDDGIGDCADAMAVVVLAFIDFLRGCFSRLFQYGASVGCFSLTMAMASVMVQ